MFNPQKIPGFSQKIPTFWGYARHPSSNTVRRNSSVDRSGRKARAVVVLGGKTCGRTASRRLRAPQHEKSANRLLAAVPRRQGIKAEDPAGGPISGSRLLSAICMRNMMPGIDIDRSIGLILAAGRALSNACYGEVKVGDVIMAPPNRGVACAMQACHEVVWASGSTRRKEGACR